MNDAPIYYDPDYRRDPKDWKKPFCCRCQRNLDTSKAVAVTINEETMMMLVGHGRREEIATNAERPELCGDAWIGKDCLKKLRAESLHNV